MKYLLLFTVAIQIASNANGLPLPAGQIVKYRVPSKYFTKPNETAAESSSSLYSFLSQIHYNGSSPTATISTNDILSEDVSSGNDVVPVREAATEINANKSPEASNDNVTNQQMDAIKVNDDFQSLIEKVVNDELKKLAHERPQQQQQIAVEVIKHSSVPLLNVVNRKENILHETTTTALVDESITEEEEAEVSDTTDSVNLNGESALPTIPPTVAPAVEELQRVTQEVEATTNNAQPEEEEDDDHVSDSLLSAVGDLLSSILGLDGTIEDEKTKSVENNNKNEVTSESQLFTSTEANETEQGTEKIDEASTPVGYKSEESVPEENSNDASNASQDKPQNEVDVKIENLAIAQTSFATENIPEQFTETVSEDMAPEMLEVISVTNDEKTDSIEQRINQVMDLVKGTEGRLTLQAMGNVVDSTLIDKEMKNDVNNLAQIVYGTLKEAQSNFGLNQESEKTSNSFSPAFHEDLIKKFEIEINDSLVNKNDFDHENFMPNSAKAALHYKHDEIEDF